MAIIGGFRSGLWKAAMTDLAKVTTVFPAFGPNFGRQVEMGKMALNSAVEKG